MVDDTVVDEGSVEETAPSFRHSPYRMIVSVDGDTVFMERHYTEATRFKGRGRRLEEVELTLEDIAEKLSRYTSEVYFVAEHTFTNRCAKCVDSVPKSGFRGN